MKDRIKKIRSVLGLTQQEFADRVGIKRNTVASYETGRNEPIDAIIILICREFCVNERWLRDGEGDMFVPDPDSELEALVRKYNLSLRDKALVRSYMELDERQRAAVTGFLLDMAERCREEEKDEAAAKEAYIKEKMEEIRRQLELEWDTRGVNRVPREGEAGEGRKMA